MLFKFDTFANEITSIVNEKCTSAIDSAEAFSSMITSSVNSKNGSWPYVTVDDFTSKARRLSTLSGAYEVVFAPIVYPEDFDGWAVHSYLNLPSYYEEAIRVDGLESTTQDMLNRTIPVPWHPVGMGQSFNETDPTEPEIPVQLLGLRERIGFDGFFVRWQSTSLQLMLPGLPLTTNMNLLYTGFEDAFATATEFNIPAFDGYRNFLFDPETGQIQMDPETGDVMWESQTQMVQPIFETIYNGEGSREDLKMVGALMMLFDWRTFLLNLLSKGDIRDVDIVLRNTCSLLARPVTYRVTNGEVVQVGVEDLHDPEYDELVVTSRLFQLDLDDETQGKIDWVMAKDIEASVEGGCISEIFMDIYPTQELEDSFYTNSPWVISGGIAVVFVFTGLIFFVYDVMVKRRQSKVMERIIRQDKIVLNTFPKAIRDKLYNDAANLQDDSAKLSSMINSNSNRSLNNSNGALFSGQLAELYPSATVVFADIVGFTAWSSAREPNQVFKLLETIYKEFDRLAYRNNIYKVETVGDCYVAVAGLPEKNDNHALAVAKFSRDCMHKMSSLVRKLEILLGPDTADLQLRIGLNTGQVTAGVLRGDKARFQLFGDTVNTASRMETTSQAGRIHVSSSTADALREAGRHKWLRPRPDTILVKGKGQMQTYFLETVEDSVRRTRLAKYKNPCAYKDSAISFADSVITEESSEDDSDFDDVSLADFEEQQEMSKLDRLVEWNTEILSHLLKQILVTRPDDVRDGTNKASVKLFEDLLKDDECGPANPTTVLDEFQEIIELPSISAEELSKRKHPDTITLRPVVVEQLRDLIKKIASMYNDNAFHNFEHASHVTASVRKLLTRIVDADDQRNSLDGNIPINHELKDTSGHSYGITSDPLTQFAVVFSAVIHDVDHPGVPNTQLVKENTRMAQIYRKSIAEQNSVELVWELLMSPAYDDLRACIYSSEEELKRFRQLVINTVMATDIVDKELQSLRKLRWEKAFSPAEEPAAIATPKLDINRKATIVIEHLIQASDVSHTMQHWNIYKKWNERFFFELYDAYKNGRAEKDPSIGWYKGEIGFFDFYIIPLAKKLERCGVFGVSSHEFLSYAQNNRDEWVREGENVVQEFLDNYKKATEEFDKAEVADDSMTKISLQSLV